MGPFITEGRRVTQLVYHVGRELTNIIAIAVYGAILANKIVVNSNDDVCKTSQSDDSWISFFLHIRSSGNI
jgi:hypothetical protein